MKYFDPANYAPKQVNRVTIAANIITLGAVDGYIPVFAAKTF